MNLKAIYFPKGEASQEVTLQPTAAEQALLAEMARRALGLHQARLNAKARQLLAEDYAPGTMSCQAFVFGFNQVHFDASAGYAGCQITMHAKSGSSLRITAMAQAALSQLADTHQAENCPWCALSADKAARDGDCQMCGQSEGNSKQCAGHQSCAV